MLKDEKEKINLKERGERIRLISEVMSSYLSSNSKRPDEWYSEKFDYLYDLDMNELKVLHALFRK